MKITLKSPAYADRVAAPTSKSAAHRALICAAFAKGETDLYLHTTCADIAATRRCLAALGAEITGPDTAMHVKPLTPETLQKGALLDCGESGSTLRFLLPICGAIGADATFIRRGRLPQRPLGPLASVLREKGMEMVENGEKLLTGGRIAPGCYTLAANISSQYISGLLFALSLLEGPSSLALTGAVESAPYIAMTADMLGRFGAHIEACPAADEYRIGGSAAAPLCSPGNLLIEGDFSGAAFPLALGAIGTHPVTVSGLSLPTLQGDAEILDILARFGAKCKITDDTVTVSPAPLTGIDIDARQIPDLVPILAVVAAAATGTTHITGAERLRLKESDRLTATTALLCTLGGDIEQTADGLIIRGGRRLRGGIIDTAADHRIAMSAAACALLSDGAVVIPGASCVDKSYPNFFDEVLFPTTKE